MAKCGRAGSGRRSQVTGAGAVLGLSGAGAMPGGPRGRRGGASSRALLRGRDLPSEGTASVGKLPSFSTGSVQSPHGKEE